MNIQLSTMYIVSSLWCAAAKNWTTHNREAIHVAMHDKNSMWMNDARAYTESGVFTWIQPRPCGSKPSCPLDVDDDERRRRGQPL